MINPLNLLLAASDYNAFWTRFGDLPSFRQEKCLAQPKQAAAAGALEERGLGTSVALTAHNHSITWLAVTTGEGPGHVLSQRRVSLSCPSIEKHFQVLWQSIPVFYHLLNKNFPSVFVKSLVFQCVPIASFSLSVGITKNRLASSSLLPHRVKTRIGGPWINNNAAPCSPELK